MSIKKSTIPAPFSNHLCGKQIFFVKQWIYKVAHDYLEQRCKNPKVIAHACFSLVNIILEKLLAFSNNTSISFSKDELEICYKYHTNVIITDDNMQLYSLVALVNIFERTSLISYLKMAKKDFYNRCTIYPVFSLYKVDALIQSIPELFDDLCTNDYEIFLKIVEEKKDNYEPKQLENITSCGVQLLKAYVCLPSQAIGFPYQTTEQKVKVRDNIILRTQAAFWAAHYFLTNPQPKSWESNWIYDLPLDSSLSQNSNFISMLHKIKEIIDRYDNHKMLDKLFDDNFNIYTHGDETVKIYQMMKKNISKNEITLSKTLS